MLPYSVCKQTAADVGPSIILNWFTIDLDLRGGGQIYLFGLSMCVSLVE